MDNSNSDTINAPEAGKESPSPASPSSISMEEHRNWKEAQDSLKNKLIAEDYFSWKIPTSRPIRSLSMELGVGEVLKYVGGVDISFSKKDSSVACGILVVLDLHSLEVVYEDFSVVTLDVPYVPGFLAFREAPVLLELLEKMKNCASPLYPQLLMVDGNGVLHPRAASRGWPYTVWSEGAS